MLNTCIGLFLNRCTRKERCPNAGVHPSRFVTNLSDVVEFKSINPHQVALGPSVNVSTIHFNYY